MEKSTSIPERDLPVAQALSLALETFAGDWPRAVDWLLAPQERLGQQAPLEAARNPENWESVAASLVPRA